MQQCAIFGRYEMKKLRSCKVGGGTTTVDVGAGGGVTTVDVGAEGGVTTVDLGTEGATKVGTRHAMCTYDNI